MEFSDNKLVLSDNKWINEKCVNFRLGCLDGYAYAGFGSWFFRNSIYQGFFIILYKNIYFK